MLRTTSCCPYLWWSTRAGVAIVKERSAHTHHGRHPPRFQGPQRRLEDFAEEFRNKVESRISSHGLTAADVQSFVDEIKKHPEVSAAFLVEIRSEVGKLMQGQRFSFDFD